MALRDLGAFLEDDALDVPVPGKDEAVRTYRIASPDAETGLWLQTVVGLGVKAASGGEISEADAESLQLDDDQEADFYRRIMGSTLDDMIRDGVSWVRIERVSRYAMLYFALGPEQADDALESGYLSGEAPAPNRSNRRASSRAASSGGATSTRRRASTAGTTPARKRSPRPAAKA